MLENNSVKSVTSELIRDAVSDALSGACGKHTADLRDAENYNISFTSSYADVANDKSRVLRGLFEALHLRCRKLLILLS